MILAMDSTDRIVSLSWQDGPERLHGRHEGKATEILLPAVLDVLQQAATPLSALAVVTGPGSFTGIRVGLATAQGLSLARAIPAYGFSAMALLAPLVGNGCLVMAANRHGAVCQEVINGQLQGQAEVRAQAELQTRLDLFSIQPQSDLNTHVLQANLTSLCLDRILGGEQPSAEALEPCYVRAADAIAARPLIERLLERQA